MTNTVTVGCKLPNGYIIDLKGAKPVTLSGSKLVGGAGFTPVPSDFWDAWIKKNGDTYMVKRGIIFAQSTQAKAESQARELEGVKTGLEQLARDADKTGAPMTRR